MTTNHVAIQILHGVTNVTSAKRPNQRVLVVVAAEEEDMAVVEGVEEDLGVEVAIEEVVIEEVDEVVDLEAGEDLAEEETEEVVVQCAAGEEIALGHTKISITKLLTPLSSFPHYSTGYVNIPHPTYRVLTYTRQNTPFTKNTIYRLIR